MARLNEKFEQLHIEDQLQIALETLRLMCDGKHATIERLISARQCTPQEFWQEICAATGQDECEPWAGYPNYPKKESFAFAPGADREAPPHYQKLLGAMREIAGKDRH